ncbi:MAG: glycosyltransferase family 2 protein [Leifsonia xyli]|nr:MAG: glycosyltransferase family 2 protein [Leifsonia xyli]
MTGNAAPRISVVMCTYRGAAFVEEQLASILAQSVLPHELVLGDDGSDDGTVELVRAALARSGSADRQPIELIELLRDPADHPAPYGVAGNFARALAAATGEVILLSDQDDRWHEHRVARTLELLAARPEVGLVHSDARLVDGTGRPLGVTLFEALGVTATELAEIDAGRGFEVSLRRNLVTGATAAVRRRIVQAALPIPEGWIHDEWLAIVAGATGATAVIREPLIDYRQHGANQIGAEKLSWRTRWARLREPRTARNRRLERRAASLAERLPLLEPAVAADAVRSAQEKHAHERMRSALPRNPLARLRPVLAEWRTGRYRHYGLGAQDVLRDLVQPD